MDAMKLLGSLMKNKSLSSGLGSGLLGGLLGGGQKGAQASGTSGLMGLLGGGGGGGGALSSVMGLLGGGGSKSGAAGMVSGLLGSVMGGGGNEPTAAAVAPQAAPQETQDEAVLMIRAMVNAAKSDGRIDQNEQENIIGKLGDISEAEANFLRQEFKAPIDTAGFARSVPQGMEQQIYAMSLTSIELDTQKEAQYLADLGQNLQLNPEVCNQIHQQLGAPVIFS